MPIPSDYRELLKGLNRHRVSYLIIGAYAVIYYTEPRYTKDLDIWVKPEIENAKRLYEALKEFGAPLKGISAEDFTNKNLVYQIGIEPVRVDILMSAGDLDFKQAWRERSITFFGGIKVNIIGIDKLIKSKQKANRPTDSFDIKNLQLKLRLHKGKPQ